MSSLDPAVIALLKDPTMLIPAVIQDSKTNEVLMLAYMNTESLALTLSTGKATYWSRSRNELWVKGATSGHFQKVISVALDCDGDALLLHAVVMHHHHNPMQQRLLFGSDQKLHL